MSHATVVHVSKPFNPHQSRSERLVPDGTSMLDIVSGIDMSLPTVAYLNGEVITRDEWETLCLEQGDLLVLNAMPAGKKSNPLMLILQIAIAVIAPQMGALFAASEAGQALIVSISWLTYDMLAAAAGAVFGLIASSLVSAMLAPPKPSNNAMNSAMAAPSPTYNLAAQGNQARLGQAVPCVYGRHIIFPDFAAQPYSEYIGNEQFLYQLFCLGHGSYDFETNGIRIDDTPLTDFQDVTYQIVQPNNNVTLFPTDVVTAVEVSQVEPSYNVATPAYVINPAGTSINRIAIDLVFPAGLCFFYPEYPAPLGLTVNFRIEAQRIDDYANPLGNWTTIIETGVSGATTTPQRRTLSADVTAGRYRVKMTRTSPKNGGQFYMDTMYWTAAKGFVPGTQNYGAVTMLAIKMRASEQLSGISSRRINCIVKRKLRQWSKAGGWTAESYTNNPAWVLADICSNSEYGMGQPDSKIALTQLEALAAIWTARGDECNCVMDSGMNAWEALRLVARSGRAFPFLQGGIINFFRDAPRSLMTAMFTPRNIVKGTFSVHLLVPNDDTADSVELEYFDDVIWSWRRVTAKTQDSSAVKPARLPQVFAITDRQQAWREACYTAASNKYRRKLITFTTDAEGQIPLPGDLIGVTHDVMSWGCGGDVIGTDIPDSRGLLATNASVYLSQDVEFTGGQNHYIRFRGPDGSAYGPYPVVAGNAANEVVLVYGADFMPITSYEDGEPTQFAFGITTSFQRECRVLNIKPSSDGTVEISCINEDSRVHTLEGEATIPSDAPPWTLPAESALPTIPANSLVAMQVGTEGNPSVALSWLPAGGVKYYVVEHSLDNVAWARLSTPTEPRYTHQNVNIGMNYWRVCAVKDFFGAWVYTSLDVQGIVGIDEDPPTLTGLVATASVKSIYLTWNDPDFVAGGKIEIWRSSTAALANAALLRTESWPSFLCVDEIGYVGVTRYYWARLFSKNGADSGFIGPVSATTGSVDITVGTGTNTLWNSEFRSDLSFWKHSTDGVLGAGIFDRNLAGWTLQECGTAYLCQTDATSTTVMEAWPNQTNASALGTMDVSPGEWIEWSGYTGAHRCNVDVVLEWLDTEYKALSSTTPDANARNAQENFGGVLLEGYVRIFVIAQAPANAHHVRAIIRKGGTLSGSDSYAFFTHMMLSRARSGQTEPSAYSGQISQMPGTWLMPKSITEVQIGDQVVTAPLIASNVLMTRHFVADQILGDHIAAKQIDGEHIRANSITAGGAQIDTAAINTLNLQGQSVTIPLYSGADALALTSYDGTEATYETMERYWQSGWVTWYGYRLASVSYQSQGYPVLLQALAYGICSGYNAINFVPNHPYYPPTLNTTTWERWSVRRNGQTIWQGRKGTMVSYKYKTSTTSANYYFMVTGHTQTTTITTYQWLFDRTVIAGDTPPAGPVTYELWFWRNYFGAMSYYCPYGYCTVTDATQVLVDSVDMSVMEVKR